MFVFFTSALPSHRRRHLTHYLKVASHVFTRHVFKNHRCRMIDNRHTDVLPIAVKCWFPKSLNQKWHHKSNEWSTDAIFVSLHWWRFLIGNLEMTARAWSDCGVEHEAIRYMRLEKTDILFKWRPRCRVIDKNVKSIIWQWRHMFVHTPCILRNPHCRAIYSRNISVSYVQLIVDYQYIWMWRHRCNGRYVYPKIALRCRYWKPGRWSWSDDIYLNDWLDQMVDYPEIFHTNGEHWNILKLASVSPRYRRKYQKHDSQMSLP